MFFMSSNPDEVIVLTQLIFVRNMLVIILFHVAKGDKK